MPAVIDTPERIVDVETPVLSAERPQARGIRVGFWRTLAHGITRLLTPLPPERHAPSSSVRRPFETPMDRLAREHPSLSLRALAIF